MTLIESLRDAALAIAASQAAYARNDIESAWRHADRAQLILSRCDDVPDSPSAEYDALAEAIDGTPTRDEIDYRDYRDFSPLTWPYHYANGHDGHDG